MNTTAIAEHIARMERERQEARVREWNRLHFPQVERVPEVTDEQRIETWTRLDALKAAWPFPVRGNAEVVSLPELRREVKRIIGEY